MSKILELREKRAKAWEAAKKFLDSKRGEDGLLSAEDTAAYEKMEKEVVDLGKEIERLERQAAIDAELNKPTSEPITNKPNNHPDGEEKTGRATDNYRRTFWNAMRRKNFFDVENAHSETAAFALLFEFDGDIRKIRHVLYNCSASRPKIEGKTNEESREVQTETLTIKARPLASGYVKAKTGNKTSAETYANWYKSVYLPEPKPVDAETEGQG